MQVDTACVAPQTWEMCSIHKNCSSFLLTRRFFHLNLMLNFFSFALQCGSNRMPSNFGRNYKICFTCWIILIIIHWTRYLFSDWPKARVQWIFEISACDVKSADFTIIMSRTLKVTGNHVMYDRGAWFLRIIMSSSRALCYLSSVKK